MPTIGRRRHELRINEGNQTWRIVDRIDPDAVIILEVLASGQHKHRSVFSTLAEKGCRNTTMNRAKRKKLEKKGWKVGTLDEFLDLSPEESAYIEVKLKLSESLRKRRKGKSLTQSQFARLVKSSQSRIAKMEAGDPSVSIDLLIRSLLALGATRRELAKIIATPVRSTAA